MERSGIRSGTERSGGKSGMERSGTVSGTSLHAVALAALAPAGSDDDRGCKRSTLAPPYVAPERGIRDPFFKKGRGFAAAGLGELSAGATEAAVDRSDPTEKAVKGSTP